MSTMLCAVLQVLSNIVSVQAHQVDRDEKTWHFSNRVMSCICNSVADLMHTFALIFFCSSILPPNRTLVFLHII